MTHWGWTFYDWATSPTMFCFIYREWNPFWSYRFRTEMKHVYEPIEDEL